MSRKKKFILNTVLSLFNQIVVMISGFILPRNYIFYFGSSVNGMISSITQFLGFISFMQLGVGTVVQASWYKSLNDRNDEEISKIYIATERFFRKIALVFVAYTFIIAIVYPYFVRTGGPNKYVFLLVHVLSINLFAQYFFGLTNTLLLQSDQKSYISYAISSIVSILNLIISILVMKSGMGVLGVKFVSALIMLINPMLLCAYVKRNYHIDKKIVLTEEPIKQKWNGIVQHISAVVVDNTDIIVLTLFCSLESVSVYYVYYMVVSAIKMVLISLSNGVQSFFGNLLANDEKNKLHTSFDMFELIFGFFVTLLFSITICLILPFVVVYTNGVEDTDYYQPLFGIIITLAFAIFCYRTIYYTLIKAAGHFKQTQTGAIVEVILNIVISVICVLKYGLVGVAFGTLIAVSYRTVYCVWYLSKEIICRKSSLFFKNMLLNVVIFFVCYFFCNKIALKGLSFVSWLKLAVPVALICLIVCALGYTITYYKKISSVIKCRL